MLIIINFEHINNIKKDSLKQKEINSPLTHSVSKTEITNNNKKIGIRHCEKIVTTTTTTTTTTMIVLNNKKVRTQ